MKTIACSLFWTLLLLCLTTGNAVGATVSFTFEQAGVNGNVEYGTQNLTPVLPEFERNGFLIDVKKTTTSTGLHFHEIDSLSGPTSAHSKVPDRLPDTKRGVLWRDSNGGDPLFFTRTIGPFRFSLESLVLARGGTADNSNTTAVRLTAFEGGTAIATVDLTTATLDGYESLTGSALGALEGLFMDRLEFVGLTTTNVSYYQLDDMIFNVVPEPSTLVLAALALVTLLAHGRRRRA